MSILQQFKFMAEGKNAKIGIGLGISEFHNKKILNASIEFLEKNDSKIYLFGHKTSLNDIRVLESYEKNKSNLSLVESPIPYEKIFQFLRDKKINAIVRGSLNSNKFLLNLKQFLSVREVNRLALLETVDGHQFFYGPVGIDECNNFKKKVIFVKNAIIELKSLSITPNISILSGGRKDDLGRDSKVDESIKIASKVVKSIKEEDPDLLIRHDEIMIESAIEKRSNLIIAPDGIAGNLIYRTLVHLGGGKAHGAIYMGLDQTIVDTSRVGEYSEIYGALLLALALSK